MNVRIRYSFNILLIHICLLFNQHIDAAIKQDPLLVCAIMIKNEAPVIAATLQAMVDGGIDSFLVYDTGSTDDTIAVVEQFFQKQNITNFAIEQEEFVDFSTSRNRALDLVDKHFPEATFIFMPDAEWILYNGQELLKFCEENKNNSHASYEIRLIMGNSFEFNVRRLIRKKSHPRFKGAVHECLEYVAPPNVPASVFIEYKPAQYGAEKSFKRFTRDLDLLLKEYAKNPKDPRTVFYLSQTYACLGDHESAIRFYELRTKLTGWAEENFMAMYRLAQEVEAAAQNANKESFYDWPLAQYYYLKAFSMRSSRIEPLMRIAWHYLNTGEYALAYLFAWRATNIEHPKNDKLFVEKNMYTYDRYDILGRCAWYIGEFDAGERALKKALKKHPGDKHLEGNLSFYEEHHQQDGSEETARPELVEACPELSRRGNERLDIGI